jgi:HK97 family phage major capsid protein
MREAEREEIAAELRKQEEKKEEKRGLDPNAEPSEAQKRTEKATEERRQLAEDLAERRGRGLPPRLLDEFLAKRANVDEGRSDAFNAALTYAVARQSPDVAARHDMRDLEKRALQADLDVSGGYLVAPQQFVTQLIKGVDDAVFMLNRSTSFPVTSSDSLGAPSLDTDPADPAWTAEIGAISEDSSMAFGGRELVPHQLTKLVKVAEKLLMISAIPPEPLVRQRLEYKFSTTFESAALNGDGAGKPLGIFTASAQGISTGRDVNTDMSTTAVTFDGLKSVKGTLKQNYRGRAVWVAHRDLETQVAKLKDGEGQYQWQQSTVAGDPDRLLGSPLLLSEYAPNTFTTGQYVAVYGDLSWYWTAIMQSVVFQRLNELYIANGQIGFRSKMWGDGMPVLEEAFVRAKLA